MIYLGSDHAGFELKEKTKQYLAAKNIAFEDLGPAQLNPEDDYPDYGFPVALAVGGIGVRPLQPQETGLIGVSPLQTTGMLFCESAGGMEILANKVKGVRAVECATPAEVKHAREQNDANILVISKMAVGEEALEALLDTWLNTKFTDEERHTRRLKKIADYEQEHWK